MSKTMTEGLKQLKRAFEQRVFEYHSDLHAALYLKSTGRKLHGEINDLFERLTALLAQYAEKREAEKSTRYRSFCGCPMCLHHTEAFELYQANNTRGEK